MFLSYMSYVFGKVVVYSVISGSDYKISAGDYIITTTDYIITDADYKISRHLKKNYSGQKRFFFP